MTSDEIIVRVKKHPIGFACGLVSVCLAGLLYFRSDEVAAKQTEYDTKAAEAAKITSNVTISRNLPEQVADIQAMSKDLESRLVAASQLAVNLQYFYKLEAENDVKLLEVRQGAQPKKGATIYNAVPFNVTVQGSYKQVMLFLNRLENGRHLCRFTNVIFAKSSNAADPSLQNAMTLTLNLELLAQP